MSLKYFHIVFITFSTLLTLGCAIGGYLSYRAQPNSTNLLVCLLSLLVSIALVTYGFWFWKKIKKIIL